MSQNTVPEAMPEQVETAPAVVDPLERFTDRELILRLVHKLDLWEVAGADTEVAESSEPDLHTMVKEILAKLETFEALVKEMAAAADKNPMFKMMFGKFLGN